jgi:signal transduction histidine kinase
MSKRKKVSTTSDVMIPLKNVSATEPDLPKILMRVLETALKEVGGVRGSVVLVDPLRAELVILAKVDPNSSWPPSPDQKVRVKFRVGEGIAGHVAQAGESYNAPIASQDPYFIAPTHRSNSCWSLLAVPIIARSAGNKTVLGVISIEGPDDKPAFFDDHAIHTVASLGDETVASIEGAMLPALVQSALSFYRLRRIQAVSQALVSQETLEQILGQIARIAFEELQADLLTLYSWDATKLDFITPPIKLGEFLVPDAMGTEIHRGDVVDKVFREWGSQFFPKIVADPKFLSLGRVPARQGQPGRERFPVREKVVSAAILRLGVGTKKVGVLCVNWRSNHIFDDGEQVVLEIFANHVAVAIENARLMRMAVAEATAAQRERLFRDLHDEVAGRLTAIKHHKAACLNYLEQKSDASVIQSSLNTIEQLADEAHIQVRSLLVDLEPITKLDLKRYLERLCTDRSTSQCSVTAKIHGPVTELREGVPESVFRIAREAISNAQRHGQASEINVTLSISNENMQLEIVDNGRGGYLPSLAKRREAGSFGTIIMEQVAFALGGELNIGPRQEAAGWRVSLRIDSPLRITA